MFYGDCLTNSFDQDINVIERMIKINPGFSKAVLDQWLIRTGGSPRSNLAVSEIGIYTDFT